MAIKLLEDIFNPIFFKDNKFNCGRLYGVVHIDKEGKLRLGYLH